MKKKIMANLLVGSAVVGASLAPLSAQAVTTGNTPVQVEFGGGVLPEGDYTGAKDPDPNTLNSDFDLLYIPRSISFARTAISADLSSIKSSSYANYAVGDLRGTKEGWHVTATILEMANGEDKLTGAVSFNQTGYVAYFDEVNNGFKVDRNSFNNSPVAPEFPTSSNITIGGGALLVGNAVSGKGQGMWNSFMTDPTLNVTTPYQQIKAGNYTGNITWNLVAGPSI
ncbi:WxL domain-containing protein [Enterococcus faecalis]|uniref:WxL domain-containing protein n=1 Tax=Enterococcus faecalis TaxID=1351 RepID=UPI0025AF723B|nr:WxL domain-containing protein [Enterococcus faecalis]MDN3076445.1 WxL domain-containing protein [Enterococcus faecalis]